MLINIYNFIYASNVDKIADIGGVQFTNKIKKSEIISFLQDVENKKEIVNFCSFFLNINITNTNKLLDNPDDSLLSNCIILITELYYIITKLKNEQYVTIKYIEKLIQQHIFNIQTMYAKIYPNSIRTYLLRCKNTTNNNIKSVKNKNLDISIQNLMISYGQGTFKAFRTIDIMDFYLNQHLSQNEALISKIEKRIPEFLILFDKFIDSIKVQSEYSKKLLNTCKSIKQKLKNDIKFKEEFFNRVLVMIMINFHRDFKHFVSNENFNISNTLEHFYIDYDIDQSIMGSLVREVDILQTNSLITEDLNLQQFNKLYISILRSYPTLLSRFMLYFRLILLCNNFTKAINESTKKNENNIINIISNSENFLNYFLPIFKDTPYLEELKKEYIEVISNSKISVIKILLKSISDSVHNLLNYFENNKISSNLIINSNIYESIAFPIEKNLFAEIFYTIFSPHTIANNIQSEFPLISSERYINIIDAYKKENINEVKIRYKVLISQFIEALSSEDEAAIKLAVKELIFYNRYGLGNFLVSKIQN